MAQKSTNVRMIQLAAGPLSTVAPNTSARLLAHLFTSPTRRRRPSRERAWLKDATSFKVLFDHRRHLVIHRWGKGPVILLVHGWAGRGSQLGALVEPLVSQGFTVVAFDAPAHGRADGRNTALPEFAQAIRHVASIVGPVHGLVAHSMGAAATSVAIAQGLDVERLVYIAPPENPERYLHSAARWLGFDERVATLAKLRLESRYGLRFDQARGSNLTGQFTAPLLVIHDAGDEDVPHTEGERLVASWPGARLMTTQGLGHRRILRDPKVLMAVVDEMVEPEEAQVAS
ncbi:MAG: alpha/beta hydrolase [Bradymonadia bacterium]